MLDYVRSTLVDDDEEVGSSGLSLSSTTSIKSTESSLRKAFKRDLEIFENPEFG